MVHVWVLSHFSHVRLFVTVAHQASLSMGSSRQEYWSGLPCPLPGDIPNPGIKPASPALQEYSIVLSHKKEWIWVRSSEVDECRVCYTEWNQSEKEKPISYINAYIWNLEKQYWWTYLEGRPGDADVENRLVDTEREGESGGNRKNNITIYTLLCVK